MYFTNKILKITIKSYYIMKIKWNYFSSVWIGKAIAFIGLAVDNLIRTWADQRKKLLGLD